MTARGVSQQTKQMTRKMLKENPQILMQTLHSNLHNLNIELDMLMRFHLGNQWIHDLYEMANLRWKLESLMKQSFELEKRLRQKKDEDLQQLKTIFQGIMDQFQKIKSMFDNVKKITDNIRRMNSEVEAISQLLSQQRGI